MYMKFVNISNAFVISFGIEGKISMTRSESAYKHESFYMWGMVKSSLVDIHESRLPLRVEVE